mgnify:FL=1
MPKGKFSKKIYMIKPLRKLHYGEPACQNRSDADHLKFVIYKKEGKEQTYDFSIELNGIKCWAVQKLPSLNPLNFCPAEENRAESERISDTNLLEITGVVNDAWDKSNYIPIDYTGTVLTERQACQCLKQGSLKFFLQGKKLVGEFVLMKKEDQWLLMKRHDEFASYNRIPLEAAS